MNNDVKYFIFGHLVIAHYKGYGWHYRYRVNNEWHNELPPEVPRLIQVLYFD